MPDIGSKSNISVTLALALGFLGFFLLELFYFY